MHFVYTNNQQQSFKLKSRYVCFSCGYYYCCRRRRRRRRHIDAASVVAFVAAYEVQCNKNKFETC